MINPYQLLKYNRVLKSHALKCLGVLAADALSVRHLSVRMDPFVGCNLRCQMCYYSSPEFQGKRAEILPMKDFVRIAGLMFPKAIQVILGTGAEPTLHPELSRMVEIAKRRYRVPFVGISTNGQMLTEGLFRRLVEAGIDEVMVSMHGVRKETYERLQPPATYEKLHRAFENLTKLAAEGHVFRVRVNFTVNPDNFAELAEFFEVFGHYKIDVIQVRKIFDLGETAYRNRDLSGQAHVLETIALELEKECRSRGVTLMRPSFDASPEADENPLAAILLPLVHRHVEPGKVWRDDFDWRNESYEEYLERIGWYRQLLRMAFGSKESVLASIQEREKSLGYQVA